MRLVEDLERLLAEIELDEGALAERLDRAADTAGAGFGVDGAGLVLRPPERGRGRLGRAADTAVAVFGVDGAGLMLRLDDDGMELVGGSSDTARALERAQTEL